MNPITDWVSLDVETEGDGDNYALQPWRAKFDQARIRTYALSWVSEGKMCNTVTADIDRYKMSKMLTTLAEGGKTIITWKGTFDIAWFVAYGLIAECRACKWLDAMVLWKNYDRTRNMYSLKEAVRIFIPAKAGYEEGVDFDTISDEDLMLYNVDDTDLTLMLAFQFWGQLTERERTALLIDFCDMVAIAERNVEGLLINIEGVQKTASKLTKQRTENLEKLRPHLETIGQLMARGGKILPAELRKRFGAWDNKDPERFNKVAPEPAINLDSDKQVQILLFEEWGLPVYKLTKGGANSVDKESLIELSHDDERALWVQKYRETTGLLSKCVKAVVAAIKYNNPYPGYSHEPIVRPELNKAGTSTDRCTYSSYQNTKKRKVVKKEET